jgi:signal transduction histidine kinase
MSGYAESLLRTAKQQTPTQRSRQWVMDLETIRDEAFRCKRITQNLLDLSRLGDEHRERVPIAPIVESCARLIAAWPASRGVTFEIQPSNCDDAMVLASEPELKQVVLNLLANAVEATAPSRGTVTLAIERNNGWVEVVVRDDGEGMTPDVLARVFEPFFSTGKHHSGLGLGLSISHAIARRHGGALEASSPGPGRGATLVLKLPVLAERQ